jgi:hypothetical protein
MKTRNKLAAMAILAVGILASASYSEGQACNGQVSNPNPSTTPGSCPGCVQVTVNNCQCVSPNPPNPNANCVGGTGQVSTSTSYGTCVGFAISLNICVVTVGINCQHCVYTGNPVTGSTTGYTCNSPACNG